MLLSANIWPSCRCLESCSKKGSNLKTSIWAMLKGGWQSTAEVVSVQKTNWWWFVVTNDSNSNHHWHLPMMLRWISLTWGSNKASHDVLYIISQITFCISLPTHDSPNYTGLFHHVSCHSWSYRVYFTDRMSKYIHKHLWPAPEWSCIFITTNSDLKWIMTASDLKEFCIDSSIVGTAPNIC